MIPKTYTVFLVFNECISSFTLFKFPGVNTQFLCPMRAISQGRRIIDNGLFGQIIVRTAFKQKLAEVFKLFPCVSLTYEAELWGQVRKD